MDLKEVFIAASMAKNSGGAVSPEQIDQAVESYLERNPVSGGGSEEWELVATIPITSEEQISRVKHPFDKGYKKLFITFGSGGEQLVPNSDQSTHATLYGWKDANSNNQIIGSVPYAQNNKWTGYAWMAQLIFDKTNNAHMVSQSIWASGNSVLKDLSGNYNDLAKSGFTAFELGAAPGYYFSAIVVKVWGVPL